MEWKEGAGKQRDRWETAKQKGLGEEVEMEMVPMNSSEGLKFEAGGWRQASEGLQAGPRQDSTCILDACLVGISACRVGIFIPILLIRLSGVREAGFHAGLLTAGPMLLPAGYRECTEGFSHDHKEQGRLADSGAGMWMLKISFRISGHLRRFKGSVEKRQRRRQNGKC